jgi:hypothetical protein
MQVTTVFGVLFGIASVLALLCCWNIGLGLALKPQSSESEELESGITFWLTLALVVVLIARIIFEILWRKLGFSLEVITLSILGNTFVALFLIVAGKWYTNGFKKNQIKPVGR